MSGHGGRAAVDVGHHRGGGRGFCDYGGDGDVTNGGDGNVANSNGGCGDVANSNGDGGDVNGTSQSHHSWPPQQHMQQNYHSSEISSSKLCGMPPVEAKADGIPPARTVFGIAGRKCLVRANNFLVELKHADPDLHHYDIAIIPEGISEGVSRAVIEQLVDLYRESQLGGKWPACDGRKNLYTSGPLPFTSKEFMIRLSGVDDKDTVMREREFKVTIRFVEKVDLHHLHRFLQRRQMDAPLETIRLLDVALQEMTSNINVTVPRSFFSFDSGYPKINNNGVEDQNGCNQRLCPTQIDISATSFDEPLMVPVFVARYLNLRDFTRPLTDTEWLKVKQALVGIKVETTHRPGVHARYQVTGISELPASQLMFPGPGNIEISVAQYFKDKYKLDLQLASWPCLHTGSDSKPTFLPMEVCRIVPTQRYTQKLNGNQTANMSAETCQLPNLRESDYIEYYPEDELVSRFGIQLINKLTTVEARLLRPPVLKYHETGQENLVRPAAGAWNMINKRVVDSGSVDFWACVNFSKTCTDSVAQFCNDLIDICRNLGMAFAPEPIVGFSSTWPENIEEALYNVQKQSVRRLGKTGEKLQLLIIVLPEIFALYGKIKRICETELGVVSQCCKSENLSRNSKRYRSKLVNIAMKINVKVGGCNTVLNNYTLETKTKPFDEPTIVFGADVTHSQPGEDGSAPISVAAVVASMGWPEITKYRCLTSTQKYQDEIIRYLYTSKEDPQKGVVHGGMVREHLIAFTNATKYRPRRIIFYRDGVSEGQFNNVLFYEKDAIRKACASLEYGYLPTVTFVFIQKSHRTRLFHAESQFTDKIGNILAGTLVNTKICGPTNDFYLCSHPGIQGTTRPTHYHVLYDENHLSTDALQKFTNNLCYTYARCTRSVALVPPAYYAHLAALRTKYYMEGDGTGCASAGSGNVNGVRALPNIKENVKDLMFFC